MTGDNPLGFYLSFERKRWNSTGARPNLAFPLLLERSYLVGCVRLVPVTFSHGPRELTRWIQTLGWSEV